MSTKTNAHVKNSAPATNPSKNQKKDKIKKKHEVLTETNVAKAVIETKKESESKYLYPADIKSPAEKKTFRRNARAQRNRYAIALEKLKASNDKKDKAELHKLQEEQKEWIKNTYTVIPS